MSKKMFSDPRLKVIETYLPKSKKGKKPPKPRFIRTRPKYKKSLTKQVKEIKKTINADQAHHTYKSRVADYRGSAVNTCSYTVPGSSITCDDIETAIANLRYYNPAVPGTLTTASGATGTYHRDIMINSASVALTMRNNYQVPIDVRVYLCAPKANTNDDPTSVIYDGVSDQFIAGGNSDTNVYPNDVKLFRDTWTSKCIFKGIIDTGKEKIVSHSVKNFNYDPSVYDDQALKYQKRFKNFALLVRYHGCLAHDNGADEQGLSACGMDILIDKVVKITYDAGANLDDYYISNTLSSFTTSAVMANKPVSDNQAFSQS